MPEAKRWYKSGNALLKEIDESSTGPGKILLWFLGQAGFVIKINGIIIYIDAILHDYESGNGKRLSPPPFPAQTAVAADYFVCTHDHSDHLNLQTLLPQAKGNPQTIFIVPAPLRHILINAGIEDKRVLGAREGEEINLLGKAALHPVAAAHSEYRKDAAGDDFYLGYILRGGGVSVYHAGDGIVTKPLVEALQKIPVNIAILPINGADWERTEQGIIGNMNSEDAAKLARAINADVTIPSHFDFIKGNTVNPAHFTDVFYTLCPEKKFHIPALGERFIYCA